MGYCLMTPLQVEKTIRHYIDGRFKSYSQTPSKRSSEQRIKRMCFGDLTLSIQASDYHYYSPKKDCDYYYEVEVGFPNFDFSEEFIHRYADDIDNPQDTVYGYVPINILSKEISEKLNNGADT